MSASDWLTEAEQHVDRAMENIRTSPENLIAAEKLLRETGTLGKDEVARLYALRAKLVVLQTKAAYGRALYAGLEQIDSIGYRPQGLEQAL